MSLTIENRFWIKSEKGTIMGEGRATLIERIDESGSITNAAKSMDMSYRKALKLIDIMNESAPEPLVVTAAGGKDGGGAEVTEYGRKTAAAYRKIQGECDSFLQAQLKSVS